MGDRHYYKIWDHRFIVGGIGWTRYVFKKIMVIQPTRNSLGAMNPY